MPHKTILFTRRRRVTLLIAAIVALASTSLSACPASASEPKLPKPPPKPNPREISPHSRKMMRAQAPLLVAADEIDRAITELGLSGLGGIQLSVPQREVRLYWKGRLPGPVLQSIKRRVDRKVRIRVLRARYTKRELLRQEAAFGRAPGTYPGVRRVTVLPDGSGLEVGVRSAAAGRRWAQ